MLSVIVYDIPASESGALAILKDFYSYVLENGYDEINWTFVVSTEKLKAPPDGSHVRILRYPAAKLSWSHRIGFELALANRIARNHKADVIFSLQNAVIFGSRIPQVIYVHQSLPYIKKRFSYFRNDERFLAIYADIFRIIIGYSVRKAAAVIVQTTWLKNALVRKHGIGAEKVHIVSPAVNINVPSRNIDRDLALFFYPTTPYIYKNIDLILDAVIMLRKKDLAPKVLLTINGDENGYASRIRRRVEESGLKENIKFLGRLSREETMDYYCKATLLFPSRLESFGLPLLEARVAGGRIIASDTLFAREILEKYSEVVFHGEADAKTLERAMIRAMETPIQDSAIPLQNESAIERSTEWKRVIDLIVKHATPSE